MADRTFRAYETRRAAEIDREIAARRLAIESAAAAMAATLARRFQLRRVVLFGSAVSGDVASGSDVDLAVEGLAPAEYLDAWLAAEGAAGGLPFDLVRLEDAGEPLRRAILEGGRVLFDGSGAAGR